MNIMGSNGGAMSLDTARRFAARTFLSGPVGGATGAMKLMSLSGVQDFITFDMGGTSTDVALFRNQMPRISYTNQIDAYLLQIPQLDIHTIGAGGGSIAWLQPDLTLEVGPRSAGALPGPACYGRGGGQPRISDANVILGRLPASQPSAADCSFRSRRRLKRSGHCRRADARRMSWPTALSGLRSPRWPARYGKSPCIGDLTRATLCSLVLAAPVRCTYSSSPRNSASRAW